MFELAIGRIVHVRLYSTLSFPKKGACRSMVITSFDSEEARVGGVVFSTDAGSLARPVYVAVHESKRSDDPDGYYWHAWNEKEHCE